MESLGDLALEFKDFWVSSKRKRVSFRKHSSKTLLHGASGIFRQGEITFVMGPSGSGKTTLLEAILSLSSHEVKGKLLLGNAARKMKFVPFSLNFISVLTVWQTLMFAARMYWPREKNLGEKVRSAVEKFALENVVNSLVGDGIFIRGLSGGEKRRLGVAIEFLSDPDILFLDESTTGLDSASAFLLLKTLREVCKSSAIAVVMTIHQPSELLFNFADSLLLMSSGRVEYCGPRERVVHHFIEQGQSLPQKTNVADWILQILSATSATGEEKKIGETFASQQLDSPELVLLPPVHSFRVSSSFFLFLRQMRISVMDPRIWILRVLVWFLVSVFSSTVWLQVGTSSSSIQKAVSYCFGILGFCSLVSIAAIPYRHIELEIFRKERKNGMYSAAEFSAIVLVSDVLILFFWCVLISASVYFTVGLTTSSFVAQRFMMFSTDLFLVLFTFESLMGVISSVTRSTVLGLGIAVVLYGMFVSLCGFFITISKVGWWYRWMIYINPLYYGFSSNVRNNFYDTFWTPFCDPSGFPCFPVGVNGTSIIGQLYLNLDLWESSIILVAISLAFRVMQYAILEFF